MLKKYEYMLIYSVMLQFDPVLVIGLLIGELVR